MLLFIDQPKHIRVLRTVPDASGTMKRERLGLIAKQTLEPTEELAKAIQADEKDDTERVYTTREGDVLLTLRGSTVWVSEGFDLELARKLQVEVQISRLTDDNLRVAVEAHTPPDVVAQLRDMGHVIEVSPRFNLEFGSAQMAMRMNDGYVAASDHRKDGYPVGY